MRKLESEKIAETLRGELEVGRWKAGERLPSVVELRERFGVGEWAVRHALKNLRDDGFITLRQNVGAVATEKPFLLPHGRIAFVAVGANGSYFSHMLADRLSLRLAAFGWECSPIFLDAAHDGSIDERPLMRMIANGVDFAIGLIWSKQIAALFDRACVPYVVLNGYTRDFPNAKGVVREDFRPAYCKLIEVLRARRFKTLLEFDYERTMDRGFKALLASSGMSVRRILCKFDNEDQWSLEDIRRMGHKTVSEFLSDERRRARLPDVILFDDDYFASGGLVALYEAGIRVPEDVRVVFYSNTGNALVMRVGTARIECDPFSYGDIIAEYVLKLLAGRKAAPPKICWRFVPGASL